MSPSDRKSKSLKNDGGFFRHSSLERQRTNPLTPVAKRSSWSCDDQVPDLDHFITGTLTVNSFFKQVRGYIRWRG